MKYVILVLILPFFINVYSNQIESLPNRFAVITAKTGLNLRKSPDQHSTIIITIQENEIIEIIKKNDKLAKIDSFENFWMFIKFKHWNNKNSKFDQFEGWIFAAYIKEIDVSFVNYGNSFAGINLEMYMDKSFKLRISAINDDTEKTYNFVYFGSWSFIDKKYKLTFNKVKNINAKLKPIFDVKENAKIGNLITVKDNIVEFRLKEDDIWIFNVACYKRKSL